MLKGTSFAQTQAILRALEFGIAKGAYKGNANQKKAAQALVQQMKSNKSVSGRHQQLLSILKKGEEMGFEVPYHAGLQVKKPEDIIKVSLEDALAGFRKLDHDDVDVFLHVGGALGIVDMVEELENELGRPIVSTNIATYWYALRQHGIGDALEGFGQLARKTEIAE